MRCSRLSKVMRRCKELVSTLRKAKHEIDGTEYLQRMGSEGCWRGCNTDHHTNQFHFYLYLSIGVANTGRPHPRYWRTRDTVRPLLL